MAWEIQTQAEQGIGSGSITKDELHAQVRGYLESEEYPPDLVDPLLTGTFERVGALVSRVEGTFEFEVQPLREYFAARHLYKTSPYSPPGYNRRGTRPARFDALARSFYWTNVTRFFCGFYDVGELGTLVDGLMDLDEQDGYRLINQPRRLAMMLLSDHVFAESPKTMKRLIDHITQEPAFRRLTASDMPFGSRGMGLPDMAGRGNMFDVCAKKLEGEIDSERCRILREVMGMNADQDILKSIWKQRFREGAMDCDPLQEAIDFGILDKFSLDEIEMLTKHDIALRMRWLAYTDNYEAIIKDRDIYAAACKAFFDGDVAFYAHRSPTKPTIHLEMLTELLSMHTLAALYSSEAEDVAACVVIEQRFGIGYREFLGHNEQEVVHTDNDSLVLFSRFVLEHMKRDIVEWKTQLSPWSTLVDEGFEIAPGSYLFEQIAAVSTVTATDKDSGVWDNDGFLPSKGLVNRLYFARRKAGNATWWKSQLNHATPKGTVLGLAILLSWGKPNTLLRLKPVFDPLIDGLNEGDWNRLYSFCTYIARACISDNYELTDKWFCDAGILSPRVALVLTGRVKDDDTRRLLSRHLFSSYTGTDSSILQYAADNELMNSMLEQAQDAVDDVDWDYVCRLSKLARKGDNPFLFSRQQSQLRWNIPEDMAATVLSDCDHHCGQFVAICERSYGMSIAKKTVSVSEISSQDGWFCRTKLEPNISRYSRSKVRIRSRRFIRFPTQQPLAHKECDRL